MVEIFVFDPIFYAVAVPAVILTGISKSGLGGGLGALTVALMASFISPVAAAAIMMPILVVMDVANLWGYRRDWHRRNVYLMLPGAVVGVLIGTATYRYVDENVIRIILGVIVVVFTLSFFVQKTPADGGKPANAALGVICGGLSGFTSFVAHAGGGPIKFYLLPQRLAPRIFVGTHIVFFFLVNQMKLVSYFMLGQFTADNLTTSLVLAPCIPIGVLLGWKLVDVVPRETFYKIVYAVLFLSGTKLIWDGLTRGGFV
ncbi:MAG: sulfite exporter TauE/SafE family protein [Rhodospirillaceae bacterium]